MQTAFGGSSAATAIEYGLIAAGISVAIISVVNGLGTTLNSMFTSINTSLQRHVDRQGRQGKNALRRPSGVCSLGGAGLVPEFCNAPGNGRSGRGKKGSSTSAALPKNDAEIACHGSAMRRRRERRDPAHEPKVPAGALNFAEILEVARCDR
jgi:pilus assembly protein Flp/PilA